MLKGGLDNFQDHLRMAQSNLLIVRLHKRLDFAPALLTVHSYGGRSMPRIEFRGKTYNNEFEMPPEERQAYDREKERSTEKNKTGTKPLTEMVDMSPEIRTIYERALENVEDRLDTSQPRRDLPKTEDIYRQSAPADMQHLPSDESIYRPSRPLLDQSNSVIEPEPSLRLDRLISSILWVLALVAAAFLVTRFLL